MEPKLLVGLLPIILGVANLFKVFVPSPDILSNRVASKKAALLEYLIRCHLRLFEHLRSLIRYDEELTSYSPEKALRGDDHGEEDLFANYTKESFRIYSIIVKLEKTLHRAKFFYSAQFYLTIFGFFTFFGIFIPQIKAEILFYIFLFIFILQFTCLVIIRNCESKIEHYEEST